MKNKFYLCLMVIVLFSLNFSCSKEEMVSDQENLSVEKQNTSTLVNSKFTDLSSGNNEKTLNLETELENQTNSTVYMPFGTKVYYLYLNIDDIEQEYLSDSSNPSFSGPFNIYYRELMSNHFSIYFFTESTNYTCGKVERWIVNLDELNQYLVSIGISELSYYGSDWYNLFDNDPNTGGNTSTGTIVVDPKGKKKTPPPPAPDQIPTWLFNYSTCFTM
ncbi:hypothetical protein [Winogradskyella sp. PC D3.3]